MDDAQKTRGQLIAEVQALRRQVAQLESSTVDHQCAERALEKEAHASQVALEKSEATARALLESASDGIVVVGGTGRIMLVNAAAERMFGYRREELVGAELELLLPERVRGGHVEHRVRYFAEPRVRSMGIGLGLSGRRRDGSEFPVEISLSYVESEDGVVAMAFVTDITQRKQAEAQLQRQREVLFQSEKLAALGRLAAGVAHEMNNPLSIVSSRIELMLLDAKEQHLPSAVLEDLQVLHRNTQRVARIARNLRSFARQSPGARELVNLNAVVDEALLLMQKALTTDGIQVTISLDPTLPPILGDADALHQVLLNLLSNAREAMAGRGEIRIETGPSEPAGRLRLVVRDTGPGISPEDFPNIFDPFFTTKADGTGLGLSLVYGIIQDHGGTIDVQSAPGTGTVFVLSFPVAPGP
jgi:PAS domain S-box-containing protein